ncbi:pyridoxamine 5'-phosphate oxidase family protein [Telmatospirillum sp. J64-1]|uniref:pyridoxamine 5'-phosphate oxidase family protein n=1 Tax=Telmatospirillum sp. J64-1 TaxID=2502183 RepID=UPI00115D1C67|nr:pyridoxamine 5'-phosphate oxidase family protein [Telmatospirillum sp. J64-1]
MGQFHPEITDELRGFIEAQQIYFIASAPTQGRINVSPRGLDSLRVLDGRRVALLDLTGSSNETAAHLLEDGRITVMFCAFSGAPRILRLYGRGRSVLPRDEDWSEHSALFPALPGIRQIFLVDVDSVQTSCGFGVPLFDYVGQRDTLPRWAEKKGAEGVEDYWRAKNRRSIDGLPTGLLPEEEKAEG